MIPKAIFSTSKLAWAGTLLFIDIMANPSFDLFFFMVGAIMLDFITGITKAKINKQARTSQGYRKTVVKVMQYLIPVAILWIGSYYFPDEKRAKSIREFDGWLMLFIIYIEVTSIFENMYEIDKQSMIARYLYKPALTILKFGIEHNPVTSAVEKLEKEHPELKAKEDIDETKP